MKKSIKKFFSNVWGVIRLPEMRILPGQLAFFFVLSVVPIITLLGYAASLLNLSMDFISEFLTQAFSPAIALMVLPEPNAVPFGFNFFVSLAIGFFIASNGANSMIVTSNTIYGVSPAGYLRRRIKALVMTVLIVILFLFILIVPVFGNTIIDIVKDVNMNNNVTNQLVLVLTVLKSPLSWLIMFIFIKILYTMAPDRKMKSMHVTYGAIFTTVFWTILTAIYSWYITNFGNHVAIYGSLANIVILMLWVYLLANIFVIGMALNFREEKLAKTGSIEIVK